MTLVPTPAPTSAPAAAAAPAPKRLHILKAGRWTDMHGKVVEFTPDDLAALAAGYDPALQRAPIVIGHPQANSPAFGWIKGLTAQGDDLEAEVEQLDPHFVAAVRAGRYATRSASLYPPQHASNPKPGAWYLRHLGFLGAAPPAIKGLRGADLAADDVGLCHLTLAAPADDPLQGLTADLSTQPPPDPGADSLSPPAAYPHPVLPEEPSMPDPTPTPTAAPAAPGATPVTATPAPAVPDPVALAAQADDLARQAAALAQREAAIAAREQAAAAQAEALRRTELTAFCSDLAAQAKLRDADVKPLVALLASLPADAALDFAAPDAPATAQPPATWLRDFLTNLPPLITLGEFATGARAAPGARRVSDADIARRARAYKARQDAAGHPLSFTEAVAAVELDHDRPAGQE